MTCQVRALINEVNQLLLRMQNTVPRSFLGEEVQCCAQHDWAEHQSCMLIIDYSLNLIMTHIPMNMMMSTGYAHIMTSWHMHSGRYLHFRLDFNLALMFDITCVQAS